ncbi:MAG: hypothetical protein LBG80_08920 [Bacteroidales bacterium]|jgi:hypothetical protein|nr:hypothetical protein [Bacteroidales bacterium]
MDNKELECFIKKLIGDNKYDTIHTLIPLLSGNIQYALSNNSNVKLRKLVHALFESINNDQFNYERFNELIHIIDMDSFVKDSIENIYQNHADLYIKMMFSCIDILGERGEKTNHPGGLNITLISLNRLIGTFQSVLILLRSGFHLEAEILFRIIVEQLAYAYVCYDLDDLDIIDKLEPNNCIREIKKKYNLLGMFYGELSNSVHFRTKSFYKILSLDGEKVGINTRSGKRSKEKYLYFFYLSFVFLDLCRQIDEKYIASGFDFKTTLFLAHQMFDEFREKLRNEFGV